MALHKPSVFGAAEGLRHQAKPSDWITQLLIDFFKKPKRHPHFLPHPQTHHTTTLSAPQGFDCSVL